MALPMQPERKREPFVPKCSYYSFCSEDWQNLCTYGRELEALSSGDRPPATVAQERFAGLFLRGGLEPESYWERLWAKYLFRLDWEDDPDNRSAMGPPRKPPESPVGSREDFKKLRERR